MPRLGQGTWHIGEDRSHRSAEVAALRLGLDLGMTLIDTAEMYAEGGSEEVVAEAIAGRRDEVFLVSKIYPHNASHAGVAAACARSLRRLKVNCLDLYLLHWPGSTPIHETVDAFERLVDAGKIRAWGVSNFDVDEMETLPPGCATNQVLYNLGERGIEFDLLPWSQQHDMPVMAYSPVGQGGRLLSSPALRAVADRHGKTPAQVAVAWTIRTPGVVAIPKAVHADHVRQNAASADIILSAEDLASLDAAFRPPDKKRPLAML
ncbi:MAG: aldo/keto reductase [Pseudomonadota bacterium]|nr:aldo/keto reductase [Pseudomonadota bacterium]